MTSTRVIVAGMLVLSLAAPCAAPCLAKQPAAPSIDERWSVAMRAYERDDCTEAARGFAAVAEARPKEGMAWAMLGLCEYRLGTFDEALAHLQKGRALGLSGDAQFRQVVKYHEALLLAGRSEFERAQELFAELAEAGVAGDDLVRGLGMSVLRIRPSDAAADGQLLLDAGRAEQLLIAKQFDRAAAAYQDLAARFPSTRNVSYALGRYYTATRQPAEAVAAFEKEIATFPDHVPARLGIAAIMKETDPAAAIRYAEDAVKLNPRVPLGHYLLGTLLLATSDTKRAIAELEIAEQSVREDPGLYYALSRAYARDGRTADAERARAAFQRLTDERHRAARRQP